MKKKEAPREKMAKPRKEQGKLAEGILKDVDVAIGSIRKGLRSQDLKGSLSDLVRLLQLRQELTVEQPRQVTVRWVDECQTKSSIEE
jgi:hypothetical protein